MLFIYDIFVGLCVIDFMRILASLICLKLVVRKHTDVNISFVHSVSVMF